MDELRITDAERDAASTRLRKAFAEGRLDDGELTDRLETVYRAKTASELEPAYAGLPVLHTPTPPAPVQSSDTPGLLEHAAVRSALFVCAVVTIIYLLTTPGGYFWPQWVYLGMAVSIAPILIGYGRGRS